MVRTAQLFMVDYFVSVKKEISPEIQEHDLETETENYNKRIVVIACDLFDAISHVCDSYDIPVTQILAVKLADTVELSLNFFLNAK